MTTPGESSMDGSSGYLTNLTINGQIARATNGATGTFFTLSRHTATEIISSRIGAPLLRRIEPLSRSQGVDSALLERRAGN